MFLITIYFQCQDLAKLQKRHSFSSEMKATAIVMFFANYINSGLMYLLIMDLRIFFSVFGLKTHNFINGTYQDFNVLWYDDIGSAITATMTLNIFSPHISNLLLVLYVHFRRWSDRRWFTFLYFLEFEFRFHLWYEKNEESATAWLWKPLYRTYFQYGIPLCCGSHSFILIRKEIFFRFWTLFSFASHIVRDCHFCTLLHSSRLLWDIGLISFYVKNGDFGFINFLCLVLRFWRKPLKIDDKLGIMASEITPYCLVLHFFFAIWMLGNFNILPGDPVCF